MGVHRVRENQRGDPSAPLVLNMVTEGERKMKVAVAQSSGLPAAERGQRQGVTCDTLRSLFGCNM